jgi:hypothetical protein
MWALQSDFLPNSTVWIEKEKTDRHHLSHMLKVNNNDVILIVHPWCGWMRLTCHFCEIHASSVIKRNTSDKFQLMTFCRILNQYLSSQVIKIKEVQKAVICKPLETHMNKDNVLSQMGSWNRKKKNWGKTNKI